MLMGDRRADMEGAVCEMDVTIHKEGRVKPAFVSHDPCSGMDGLKEGPLDVSGEKQP